ncbi:MAG: hypothetical protein GX190_03925 [Mollicutes bacterium]|nr:hypothetical protein [Mollicutes bacterium]
MEKFNIYCNKELTLSIYTDSSKVINKIKTEPTSIMKTIPATISWMGAVEDIEENENVLVYLNRANKKVEIDEEQNVSYLELPEQNLFFPDLVYLAIGMIANYFQKEQKYFVQSSVVKNKDGHAIMFLGDPNAGKTTLASKLVLYDGWSLISNDNVLIGLDKEKLVTFTGTKSVQMRYGAMKLYFPELLKEIPKPKDLESRDEWDIKIYVDNLFQQKGVTFDDEAIISDIYLINTVKNGDLFLREREAIDRLLLIYEHLTKQIRSNRYALISFDYPMPSFEKKEYMQDRYYMSKVIADNVNIYEAKGDIEKIVKVLRRKS